MTAAVQTEMCALCAGQLAEYDLSRVCCCLRLIRGMRDKKVAAAVIGRAAGEGHLELVRQAWKQQHGQPEGA